MRWLWLVAIAACGDNVSPRLEPVRYDIAGVEVDDPLRFHDRERGEDCVAEMWADAATYCTPAYSDAVYTDPICSQPLARTQELPSGGYAATYFLLRGQVSLRRLHPILGEIAPPDQYWVLEGAACVGPYVGDASAHFADVGAELDESRFVRLRRSAPQGNARVQRISLDTDDGLRVTRAFHDRTLASDCTLEYASDLASPRCVPPGPVPASLFGDAACTQPVLVTGGDPPAFATYGATDCPTYAPVGDEVTGAPVFESDAGACTPATLPGGERVFLLGAPLDLPSVTRERGAGARIQPITVITGSMRVADTFVHDSQLAVDCHPGLLAGTPRCLPTTAPITSYFIDEQCRDPIDVALVPESACAPAIHYAYRPEAIHPLGDAVPMQLYEVSTGDRCVPYTPPPPLVAHLVGPPLPLDTFAAANVSD